MRPVFLEAGGDAAKGLEGAEDPFDRVALQVEGCGDAALDPDGAPDRDVGRAAALGPETHERDSVVSAITVASGKVSGSAPRRGRGRTLPRRHDRRVGDARMTEPRPFAFGPEKAAAALCEAWSGVIASRTFSLPDRRRRGSWCSEHETAGGVILAAFFRPARRWKRSWTVLQGQWRHGRSRHGATVRNSWKMRFTARRSGVTHDITSNGLPELTKDARRGPGRPRSRSGWRRRRCRSRPEPSRARWWCGTAAAPTGRRSRRACRSRRR